MMLAAHGARLVVNDLGAARDGSGGDRGPAQQVVDEIRNAGGEAVVNNDDVSDWGGAQRLIQQAVEEFGRLDVLVNNAGILRDRMIFSMEEADWDSVMRVHLKGTMAPTRFAAAYWRDRAKAGQHNDARLINTTSSSGLFGNAGQSNYGAAKAGIAALTQIAAVELSRYGVTANAVAPVALTRLTEDVGISAESAKHLQPRWVSAVVTWLASPLSGDVTGQVIETSGQILAVAEGWRRGPCTSEPPESPEHAEAALRPLLSSARPRTTMSEVTSKA
jgi:NAD(P)-dependent dehydrogenase (short-subunit alcohol dehydrogenase family)